jgi:hypothetical protein
MPILDNLKNPLEKIILKSPLHGLLSEDLALVSFTDHRTGKKLSFAVEYQREKRFVRIVCSRKENCWRKFTFGSPIEITIKGTNYHGWAEIIEDREEMIKEWKALFRHRPETAKELGIELSESGEIEIPDSAEILSEYAILRIDISGPR